MEEGLHHFPLLVYCSCLIDVLCLLPFASLSQVVMEEGEYRSQLPELQARLAAAGARGVWEERLPPELNAALQVRGTAYRQCAQCAAVVWGISWRESGNPCMTGCGPDADCVPPRCPPRSAAGLRGGGGPLCPLPHPGRRL